MDPREDISLSHMYVIPIPISSILSSCLFLSPFPPPPPPFHHTDSDHLGLVEDVALGRGKEGGKGTKHWKLRKLSAENWSWHIDEMVTSREWK